MPAEGALPAGNFTSLCHVSFLIRWAGKWVEDNALPPQPPGKMIRIIEHLSETWNWPGCWHLILSPRVLPANEIWLLLKKSENKVKGSKHFLLPFQLKNNFEKNYSHWKSSFIVNFIGTLWFCMLLLFCKKMHFRFFKFFLVIFSSY